MTLWDELVGQDAASSELQAAASDARLPQPGQAMNHAWLITGPPGSGRSNAANVFAAALVCQTGTACGHCEDCTLVEAGTHPDVNSVRPEGLTYSVDETKQLIRRAQLAPARARWHVVVMEDADRLTETANNALLKTIEEPSPTAVWLLCAPSTEDLLPTIRSRCRHVAMRQPDVGAVAAYLETRVGADPAMAAFAARASQGHIGRARALVLDESARVRRAEVLRVPSSLTNISSCLAAAEQLVKAANADADSLTGARDAVEREALDESLGAGSEGTGVAASLRKSKSQVKDLEKRQLSRAKRTRRDQLDRALIDLLGFYRDVLAVQWDASEIGLINEELRPTIEQIAARSTPEDTRLRIEAIEDARQALQANVDPLLAMEALTVQLASPRANARRAL